MSVLKNFLPNIRLTGIEPVAKSDKALDHSGALESLDLVRLSTELQKSEHHNLCPKGLSVLCSGFGDQNLYYRELIAKAGGNLMVSEEENPSIDWLVRHTQYLDFVMVDADWIGDTEDTVDFLLRLRRATPTLPVILLSSEVRDDDFTAARMMACDATLKHPPSESRLFEAIRAAYETNYYFNHRSRGDPQSPRHHSGPEYNFGPAY